MRYLNFRPLLVDLVDFEIADESLPQALESHITRTLYL